jgi:hypothetical protein
MSRPVAIRFERYIQQDGWIESGHGNLLERWMENESVPPLTRLQRLLRFKVYAVECRLQPAGDLLEFAADLGARTGLAPESPPTDEDHAIYLAGWALGWTPVLAVRSIVDYLVKLAGDLEITAAGFRVWESA